MATSTGTLTSLERNKALVLRTINEIWGEGKLDLVDELYAADYVNHHHHHPDSPQVIRGRQAWKQFVAEFRKAMPDFGNVIADQIAEGELVATRFISSGTQRGEIMGMKATGKKLSWTGIEMDRIVNGKMTESWVNWDMAGMLAQMRSA